MNRKYAALVGAALGGIGFLCGGNSRADPINVTVQVSYGAYPLPNDNYFFSVTNNLSGANRIYQFSVDLPEPTWAEFDPTGFDAFAGEVWTDNDYNSAIAPGETGYFFDWNFVDYIPPSIGWTVSVEGGPNGEATEIFGGFVETIPEPSTWAMMLIGFAGLGYLGYRRPQTLADAARV